MVLVLAMILTNLISFVTPGTARAVYAADLFFSEYIEGSSNNKALEIYNGTENTVNLSEYTVELYSNGSTSAGKTLTLSGNLESGKVYVIAHASSDQAILNKANITHDVTFFNGDDALVLKHNGNIIDVIGKIGEDPGTAWGSGDFTTAEHTLVRKSSITGGDTNPSDSFNPSVEWISYPQDTFDYLGSHTMDGFGSGQEPANQAPQIIYPNPVTNADANSDVTVSFRINDEDETVTAKVYSKAQSAAEYTVQEAVYGADTGLYSATIHVGQEAVQYYISAVDSKGKTSVTAAYTIQLNQPTDVITIAEARTKAENETVTVQGIVTGKGSKIFIQDETAAINLYRQADSVSYAEGDTIKVTGVIDDYNGLLEITNFTVEVVSAGGQVPAPVVLTIDQIGEEWESKKIKLENVIIGAINTNGNTLLTDDNGKTINIYKVPALSGILQGNRVDVTAFVTEYKGTYQLHVNNTSDIVKSTVEDKNAKLPLIYGFKPANMASTFSTRPEISVAIEKTVYDIDTNGIKLYVDNQLVNHTLTGMTVSYTPGTDLNFGEHDVRLEVTDVGGGTKTAEWYFVVSNRNASYNFYYGIPHAHTSYSDGKGTPADAFEYARNNGLDFLIITDHSNWFDGVQGEGKTPNYEYNASTDQYEEVQDSEWYKTRIQAEQFNAQHGDFLALRGFEMTFSTVGHSNVINSDSYVEAKNQMTSLSKFYDWVNKQDNAIAAFNHPNWPDDSFNNLAYVPELDRKMSLIEVGNGAPPYSYTRSEEHYFKALDNGWHVGAINAQDNHSWNWGDPDNLTVVIAEDLTKESFLEALRNRRVYSTETRTLELTVKANGHWMGSVIDTQPGETLNFEIVARDSQVPIEKLQLISNGGTIIQEQTFDGVNEAQWNPQITAGTGAQWYVVKVIHTNGKWGTASPIFTPAAENDVKINNLVVDPNPTLEGTNTTLQATVTNMGIRDVQNIEVKFYKDSISEDNFIGSDTLQFLGAGESGVLETEWIATASSSVKIIAKLTDIPRVTTVTEIERQVNIVPSIRKTVLLDKAHENADVPGTMVNFMELLRRYGYNVILNESPITVQTLANVDVLVINTPSGSSKDFTADEEEAIGQWVRSGGSVMIASKSNYGNDSTLMNSLMEAIGTNIRFNNDNVYEPEDSDKYSGGMVWSVYSYNLPETESKLNENMEAIRIFSGCSLVNAQNGPLVNNAETGLEILLGGNDTSYNANPGANAYVYNEKGQLNGESIPIIAKENVGQGKIVAAGRHFYSDFEIVNDVSNTALTLKLIDWLAGYNRIRTIEDVRKNAKEGEIVTVKGTVTVPDETFYDVIYIQDETSGVSLYGNYQDKKDLPIGTEIIATGVVQYFEGEMEIAYDSFGYQMLYVGPVQAKQPLTLSTHESKLPQYTGMLVKTAGRITEHNEQGSYFKVDDGSGEAYIHVDGYTGVDMSRFKEGDQVEVIGIASVGAAGPRIRVRFREDIRSVSQDNKHITIVHTNDIHGRVKPGTYDGMGLAKVAAKIKELEAQNPGRVLVLDAGDTFHGQPIVTLSKGKSMVDIMNLMGYDAMVPGNHDFNYGKERLKELEGMADFPILAANIANQDETPFLAPYIIKDIDGIKVAIFGLATPETTYKTHPKNVEGLTFKDPVTVAQEMVNELKDKSDVIIALTHLGLDESSEVTSEDIANAVAGIDLIVDGHSHTELTQGKLVNGTLIVQAGEYDKNIGLVDMTVSADGSVNSTAQLITKADAETITEDTELNNLIAQIEEENEQITSVVVGNTEVTLDGERNHVRTNETNLGNLIADAMRDVAEADVALTNGGGIRASISVGDITKGKLIEVLPFGNYVVLKEVKGSDILAALEHGLSVYPAANGGFPHISGMRVVFDPLRAPGSRVVEVTIGQEPLDINKTYRLATNDFLAAGGDNYTMFADDAIIGEFPALDEVVAEYIKNNGTANAKKDGRITRAPLQTKIAVFSDPHYFAPELGTNGAAFEEYIAQDRKLIAQSSAITRAAVDKIKESDVEFVLVPGDLTKDGEKLSHEQFASLLAELEAAGKKVYIINGNHDINNPHAYSYNGTNTIRVLNVNPEEFKTVYKDFGYEEAIAKDPNSLSYVAEPVPGLWIIAMDSCDYKANETIGKPVTNGGFPDQRLDWIRQQLKEAEARGKTVIGMMHHGVVEHFNGQKDLFGEYIVDNWESVSEELANMGMKAVFTGHFHAQDIVKKETANGKYIYDIETGSLVTSPIPYRIVEMKDNKLIVTTKKIMDIDYDTEGKGFQEYARNFLMQGLNGLVPKMLVGMLMQQGMTQQQAEQKVAELGTVKDLIVNAMVAHYQGDESADDQIKAFISSMLESTDPLYQMLGSSLDNLYNDPIPGDNHIIIDMATGNAVDNNSYIEDEISLKLLGRYTSGNGQTGSEIVKYDYRTQKAFIVNGAARAVDIVKLTSLLNNYGSTVDIPRESRIQLDIITDFTNGNFNIGDITSVAIHPDGSYFAVTVPEQDKTKAGRVAFFSIEGEYIGYVTVGFLPDHLIFTPDGKMLLVANEGEPIDNYEADPEGSVSIIDVAKGIYSVTQDDVITVGFENVTMDSDVIIKAGTQPKYDLEPEYIVVDRDSKTAYVALQENNAIAKLDLGSKQFTHVHGLGFKDFSISGLDASDKDGGINIKPWPVLGMYMPDGIEIFEKDGKTYILTPNEGDGREYGRYTNETKVSKLSSKLALKAEYFDGYTQEQLDNMLSDIVKESQMGNLKVSSEMGVNSDGKYEALYTFGARSFSIWDASDFSLVYDSGNEFEKVIAQRLPQYFNTTNDENVFDDRSDNKGPEPEDVRVGKIGNKYYAFVGLERVGGIMVYDITNPSQAKFVTYYTSRDFSNDDQVAGDSGPEGLMFIPGDKSPNGRPLLLAAHEITGTLAVYEIMGSGVQTAAPEVTSIDVTGDNIINVPVSGNVLINYRAVVKDQSGRQMTGETVKWYIKENIAGISVDENIGVVTVTDSAVSGTFTLRAVSSTNPAIYKDYAVTLFARNKTELFTVGTPVFRNLAGEKVTRLAASEPVRVTVDITNDSNLDISAEAIVALFNRDKHVKAFGSSKEVVEAGKVKTLTVTITMPENIEGYYIKAFVWDSWENANPLSSAVKFPEEQQ
jgi:2',3'-cyclic-nucleotide 2'-phosphodiesterase (5'-nucleotidase family)/3',5'-cyclic AMP phosphodiesterase CpdA